MISKAQIKWVKSLQLKKYRHEEQCFLVQGMKGVEELLRSDYVIEFVTGTEAALRTAVTWVNNNSVKQIPSSEKELEAMGSFQSNDSILAVARMKENKTPNPESDEYYLVLDDIRDPGNLGTIIRTADWFGIKHIIASEQTTDFYNPKVISATMGSFCRVSVNYMNLIEYLNNNRVPVYGAVLSGANVHTEKFKTGGLLVIGNESNGISEAIQKFITNRISIPGAGKAESLNAAIATGIILDNIFRSK